MFFDPMKFPALASLQSRWTDIRAEYENIADRAINFLDHPTWRFIPLRYYDDVCTLAKQAPLTCSLCDAIPTMRQYAFSVLPPGAVIEPHVDHLNMIRSHLVLKAEPGADCGIEVDGQRHYWREGELVLLDERVTHWSWNRGTQTRVTLWFGIDLDETVKPMPSIVGTHNYLLRKLGQLE